MYFKELNRDVFTNTYSIAERLNCVKYRVLIACATFQKDFHSTYATHTSNPIISETLFFLIVVKH